MDETPNFPRAVIAVEIESIPFGHGAAINIAASDGTSTLRVAIFGNRFRVGWRSTTGVVVRTFTLIPAKVGAAGRSSREIIDLLPDILPDITYIQVSGRLIKRQAPGIAQAVRPDLVAERIIRGDSVGVTGINIDAQNLAKQPVGFLSIFLRIARAASIPQACIHITIR